MSNHHSAGRSCTAATAFTEAPRPPPLPPAPPAPTPPHADGTGDVYDPVMGAGLQCALYRLLRFPVTYALGMHARRAMCGSSRLASEGTCDDPIIPVRRAARPAGSGLGSLEKLSFVCRVGVNQSDGTLTVNPMLCTVRGRNSESRVPYIRQG